MADTPEKKTEMIAEWESHQSPVGFYNLALSYLEVADIMADQLYLPAGEGRLELIFDSPVRHLYAQTWELALKACLFAQGIRPIKLKKDFGHNVLRAWKRVEKERFRRLNLTSATEIIADNLGFYHSERMFAYPIAGIREYLPIKFIKDESQRFRMSRMEIIQLFAGS